MYVCAQLFISYVCMLSVIYPIRSILTVMLRMAQLFISYVCMCSVIYKLCMYVKLRGCAQLFISYVCMYSVTV